MSSGGEELVGISSGIFHSSKVCERASASLLAQAGAASFVEPSLCELPTFLNGQVYGSSAVTLIRSEVRYPAQAENPTSTVDAPPIPCTVLTMNPLAVTEDTTSSGDEDRTTGW